MKKIALTNIAKDLITGFTGIVVAYATFLSNCDRVALQPRELKEDGSLKDAVWFDLPQAEFVSESDVPVVPAPEITLALGNKVRHNLTPYKGTITSIATWVSGCIRYGVQSDALHEGGPVADECFPQSDVTLIADTIAVPAVRTGGPMSAPKSIRNPR